MVKIDHESFQCEECGFHYRDRAVAEKCEAWCKEHRSCNLEVVQHAVENEDMLPSSGPMKGAVRQAILIVVLAVILLGAAWALSFWWQNLRGVNPAVRQPKQDIAELIEHTGGENQTEFPLQLPEGFTISILTDDVSGARDVVQDSFGNLWVSRPAEGAVTLLEIKDETLVGRNDIFRGLNGPHGLALDPESQFMLYIAEEHRISRVPIYSEGSLEKIADLPPGGRHSTRSLEFGGDGRLYVSIGSTCDTCVEEDPRHAAIYSLNPDGSDFRLVASGLRNAVFLTRNLETGDIWATEMGRDHLGDDLPPDEVNIIREGFYGWPYCYGKNVQDTSFDASPQATQRCASAIPSHIDLQAHSAPLGLAFIPSNSDWPQQLWGDLLVAYHGSWNRSEPTGYKIARFDLDERGSAEGRAEDFITGWLANGEALGRPVDILVQPDGVAYISDDKAGIVYKLTAPQ